MAIRHIQIIEITPDEWASRSDAEIVKLIGDLGFEYPSGNRSIVEDVAIGRSVSPNANVFNMKKTSEIASVDHAVTLTQHLPVGIIWPNHPKLNATSPIKGRSQGETSN
jgi:hypothetical protein